MKNTFLDDESEAEFQGVLLRNVQCRLLYEAFVGNFQSFRITAVPVWSVFALCFIGLFCSLNFAGRHNPCSFLDGDASAIETPGRARDCVKLLGRPLYSSKNQLKREGIDFSIANVLS